MKKFLIFLFSILLILGISGMSQAIIIVDSSTLGFYNAAIGEVLEFTNPFGSTYLFPGANSNPNDPIIDPVPYEPDLSNAASALGNWLTDPANLNSNWSSGPQAIPANWTVNSETAIIYEINAGFGLQYENVFANFGVDNGIFVWLDGTFLSGELRPGGSVLGEHQINIGGLSAGTHYLQILREDHGGATGYAVSITGDEVTAQIPEPATILLVGCGLLGIAGLGRKKFVKKF